MDGWMDGWIDGWSSFQELKSASSSPAALFCLLINPSQDSRGQVSPHHTSASFKNIPILPPFPFFFFERLFIFERQRETEQGQGRGRERGRHRIGSRLQAQSCQRRAWHGARTHELQDGDLRRSQTRSQLSHPGAPTATLFTVCGRFSLWYQDQNMIFHIRSDKGPVYLAFPLFFFQVFILK